ncbi:hypothetical protein B0T13DRAFT_535257 [Neurospora crassa]|nr:hypothetical protein B0T13DRAFT_535257 [Neurospora crassa]
MSSSVASSNPACWLRGHLEIPQPSKHSISIDKKRRILGRLTWSSSFESFLATKYPNDKHHNSLSNINQPRRDTATFASEGPPATYLSLGVGKGRKEAVNVIVGKDDRLLVVVENSSHPGGSDSPVNGPGVTLSLPNDGKMREPAKEEEGAGMNKYI